MDSSVRIAFHSNSTSRLYYGSGERRFLAAPSDTNLSEFAESRPSSSFRSGSPSTDYLPLNIYSQRRRPREVNPHMQPRSASGSMEITPLPGIHDYHHIGPGLRKLTSSVWSPHLKYDKRVSRYSMWEPPSVNWSAETGMFGRRNVQVMAFIAGFIFPFGETSRAPRQLTQIANKSQPG